jgi:hypothetical protein
VAYTLAAMAGLSGVNTTGGNVSIEQLTNVTGRIRVDYKIDEPVIPEPVSASVWLGMLGIAVMVRRPNRR